MNVNQLRELHKSVPFQPFSIHLADGRRFYVEHPEFLAYTPTGRTILVTRPDESFAIIDLLLVTSLEVSKNRSGNGNGHESGIE